MGRTLAWLFVIAAIGSTPVAGQSAPPAVAEKVPVKSEAAQQTASPEKSTPPAADKPEAAPPAAAAPAASPVKTDVPAKAAAPAVEAATAPSAAAPAAPAPAKAAGPAAAPAVVPAAKPATAASAEPVGPGEKDVYTEFTDKVLKSETESWKDKIDPLAARYPDNVVIGVVPSEGNKALGRVV